MPLDPQVEFVLSQLPEDGPALHEMSPTEAREAYEQMAPPLPPDEVARVEDRRIPGVGGEIPLRVYVPADAPAENAPALLYLHGGGWVIGSIQTHDALCRALANHSGCVVVSVDYRLAPEHPFPAAPDDCFTALRWLGEHGTEIGVDPARIAVGGDSAGGNLAAALAFMTRDHGGPAIRHQLLIYPVTDADFTTASYAANGTGYLLERESMRWFWGQYVADEAQRSHPYASPLRAENLTGLPPAHVITAEFDPLRDEGEAYAERLRQAGVAVEHERYDGQIHGFVQMLQIFDQGETAAARAGELLKRDLA